MSRRDVRHGPSIRVLLLGAHAFAWLLPLCAFSLLRVYDVFLLRQTEHRLIAESVMVGEVYREAYLRIDGRTHDEHRRPGWATGYGRARPMVESGASYQPVEAQIDFAHPVLPPDRTKLPQRARGAGTADAAGRAIEPLLRRAQTFNLSALRVLDADGCVVATTRSEAGLCMKALPEVQRALSGDYAAVLRERQSDEPLPRLGDMRRRGKVRVFTALPVWSDGRVIGVVRASRTGLDALSSLWANRRGLLWLCLLAMLLVIGISAGLAAAIGRPLHRLTQAARAFSLGERPAPLALARSVPRELAVLHEVLFEMAGRLSQRARYVEEFASQVSHELKTPITAIRGAAELLVHGVDDMPKADQQRFAANVLDDAQRMERLVSKLLELARLENRAPEPEPAALDAGALLAQLVERYGGQVVLTLPDEPLHVAIQPELLVSVASNLIENGLRHGAGQPVRVTLQADGPRARIDVLDRGEGVSEVNRKRLFERFFTTERDHGGTGLGLAIVKAIAESRGGAVRAHFDDHGTRFSVWL